MRILDRYIIKSFVFNYLLALGVLLGMVTLLDLIVNFDSFTRPINAAGVAPSTWEVIYDICDYYGYQLLIIFQQVSFAVPLLAAGFTMVRMTRHNELTAMLAAGVSLYRVAAPIVLVSVGFGLLTIVNQEFVISQDFVIQKLLRPHGEGQRPVTRDDPLYFVRDQDNSLLVAGSYDHKNRELKDVLVILRDPSGTPIGRIVAENAVWKVPEHETTEAWIMHNAKQMDDRAMADPTRRVAETVGTINYHTSLTPQQLDLIFSRKAVDYLSSQQVRELAANSPKINQPVLYKIMYLRFTQPLMNIIMLLIGIPFLLTREPRRLIKNMFYCIIVCGVVFATTFVIFQMAGSILPGGVPLDPLLAAWLPVLIFGPLAVVMLDMIRT
jgi:lipopolysaccharide export system permease protein